MAAAAPARLPVPHNPWSAASRPALELYSVTHDDLLALRAFVRALLETRRQSLGEAQALYARLRRTAAKRVPPRPANVRRTFQTCLDELVEAVEAWFDHGAEIPPILAERVQLFLQRSGRRQWERAFLSVYLYHFAACHVGTHAGLLHRGRELEAYPARRRSDQLALPASAPAPVAPRPRPTYRRVPAAG